LAVVEKVSTENQDIIFKFTLPHGSITEKYQFKEDFCWLPLSSIIGFLKNALDSMGTRFFKLLRPAAIEINQSCLNEAYD
jgi:hypothetical protein